MKTGLHRKDEAEMSYMLRLKEAQIRYADEIAEIEMDVDRQMGGDCTIAELVALMLTRGWAPPQEQPAPE